jgi:hypothetical protein
MSADMQQHHIPARREAVHQLHDDDVFHRALLFISQWSGVMFCAQSHSAAAQGPPELFKKSPF